MPAIRSVPAIIRAMVLGLLASDESSSAVADDPEQRPLFSHAVTSSSDNGASLQPSYGTCSTFICYHHHHAYDLMLEK